MNSITIEEDIWKFPSNNESYIDYYTFSFEEINQVSIKVQLKTIIKEMYENDVLEISSIHRYYSQIKNHLIPFCNSYSIELSRLADLTPEIADFYIYVLQENESMSPNSKNLAVAGIKSFIKYGRLFEIGDVPNERVFPENTSRIFGVTDTIKNKFLSPETVDELKDKLKNSSNVHFRASIITAIESGMRISEVLTLRKGCIIDDFVGHPLLYSWDEKNNTDRYVPISGEVVEIIDQLEKEYIPNENEYLFFRKRPRGDDSLYLQSEARKDLESFLKKNSIGSEGENIIYHAFRHTIGTEMLNNGASFHQVQTQLGHKSLHSTLLYAKLKDKRVDNEYYRMGVLGLDMEQINENLSANPDDEIIKFAGVLPDGKCLSILNDDSGICNHFNACVLCNKFRTFKEDLPTHKSHLARLQSDKLLYMQEENIELLERVNEVEEALVIIIERLEEL